LPLTANPKNACAEKNAEMSEKNLYLRILCKKAVTQRTGYFHDRHFEIIRIEIAT